MAIDKFNSEIDKLEKELKDNKAIESALKDG